MLSLRGSKAQNRAFGYLVHLLGIFKKSICANEPYQDQQLHQGDYQIESFNCSCEFGGRGAGVQMKVLIVDDEPEICSLLEEFLSQRGYAVVTATSGEEGISKFAVMKPDLVLLDIRMPDIDGLQVLKQIKQSDPQTGTIMITAIKDSDTVKQALTMGVNDYIVKPIDLNHLEKLLTSWQRLFAA